MNMCDFPRFMGTIVVACFNRFKPTTKMEVYTSNKKHGLMLNMFNHESDLDP
jgi:hypothetical protein